MKGKNISNDLLLEYLSTVHKMESIRTFRLSRVNAKNQVFCIQTKEKKFVLKLYLGESKEFRAGNEWKALNSLSGQFPFVPKPVLYDPMPTLLPGPIIINPYIEGVDLRETFTGTAINEQKWLMLMKHVIELMEKVHKLGSCTITDYGEYLKKKFNLHFKTTDDLTFERLGYDSCIALYLSRRKVVIPERLTLCHGDLGTHQIIMNGYSVDTIIDWEDYGFNDPALDIGYLTFSAVRHYFPDIAKVHRCISQIKKITSLKNLEFFIAQRAIGTMLIEFEETTHKKRQMILKFVNALISEQICYFEL